MNIIRKSLGEVARFTAVVAIATVSASVFAASTWSMTDATGSLDSLCVSSSNVATGSCGAGLSVSGWSTGTLVNGVSTVTSTFNSATVYDWGSSGLGVVAKNEDPNATGPHATDNYNGTDALLLNFSTASNLSGVKIGWNGTDNPSGSYSDSDLSVFAWVGPGSPTPSATNIADMATSGWKLISNYFDVGSNSSNSVATTSTVFSSYWMVSAYNVAYGGNGDSNVDAIKVLAISAKNCSGAECPKPPTTNVPEPGSMALMGAALVGFVATRRRKQNAA